MLVLMLITVTPSSNTRSHARTIVLWTAIFIYTLECAGKRTQIWPKMPFWKRGQRVKGEIANGPEAEAGEAIAHCAT